KVVELSSVRGQPLSGGLRLPLRLRAFEQIALILGVASPEALELAALEELFAGVRARRLEQPIRRGSAAEVGRNERLGHEVRHALDDVRARELRARRDRGGGVEREASREHRQPPQDDALRLGQQLVAPVERRAQRLLARQRRAAAACEEPEAIVEPRRDAFDAERGDARGGELDGERHAVEAAADGRRRRRQSTVGYVPWL